MSARNLKKKDRALDQEPDKKLCAAARRWSPALTEHGYSDVPRAFLLFYPELGVTPLEAILLLNLVAFKNIKTGDMPYPSVKTLAARLGSDERQVRRMLKSLQDKKLLVRVHRPRPGRSHRTNQYDVRPLVERLEELCRERPERLKSTSSSAPPTAPVPGST